MGRETGHLKPPFGGLACSFDPLELAELQQEHQVIGVVGRGALGDLLLMLA